jgi:hypothetical protein
VCALSNSTNLEVTILQGEGVGGGAVEYVAKWSRPWGGLDAAEE